MSKWVETSSRVEHVSFISAEDESLAVKRHKEQQRLELRGRQSSLLLLPVRDWGSGWVLRILWLWVELILHILDTGVYSSCYNKTSVRVMIVLATCLLLLIVMYSTLSRHKDAYMNSLAFSHSFKCCYSVLRIDMLYELICIYLLNYSRFATHYKVSCCCKCLLQSI